MFVHHPVTGELVPPGRVVKRRRWDMWDDAALPSWLTSSSGTLSYTGGSQNASARGVVRATTGAVSGNTADIKLANPLALNAYLGLLFIVEGLTFSANSGYDIEMSMLGTSLGATFFQLTADSRAKIGINGTTDSLIVPYTFFTGGRRNLCIACGGKSMWAWVTENPDVGDCDIGHRRPAALDTTFMTTGQVTPTLKITTRQAQAHWFEVAAVEVRAYHN